MTSSLLRIVRGFAVALSVLPVALPALAAVDATIELRPLVTGKGRQVLLGEIATISAQALPALQMLMALPLVPAPRPGTSRTLDRAAIGRMIAARTAPEGLNIGWRGADAVTIATAASIVPAERLIAAARAAISASGTTAAQIDAIHVPRDLVLPAGVVTLSARPLSGTGSGPHRLLWIDIDVDRHFVRAVPVGFVLRDGGPAAPAQARPVATVRPSLPKPSDSPSPKPAQGVLRGESATMRATAGALALETRVLVLEDGRPGQAVRVKLPGASASSQAKVTAAHEVEIVE